MYKGWQDKIKKQMQEKVYEFREEVNQQEPVYRLRKKVEELKDEIEELGTAYSNAQKEIAILSNKIDRLKEVLSFYADKSKYDDRGAYWDIIADEGKRAREGLRME